MKIALSQKAGVDILKLDGPATASELNVLHAGVAKLLRDGRNRIIIELAPSADVSAEILRELARLDLLARELSGGVMIAGLTDVTLQQKVANFMKPPSLRAFEKLEEAIRAFTTRQSPPPLPSAAHPTKTDHEQARQEILARESGDTGALRRRIVELEAENRAMLNRLQEKLIARRTIPHQSAYQERIRTLEARVEELLEKVPPNA